MKITKSRLQKIIKEEIRHLLSESEVMISVEDAIMSFLSERNGKSSDDQATYTLLNWMDENDHGVFGNEDAVAHLRQWDAKSIRELERRAIKDGVEFLGLYEDDDGIYLN